MIVGDQLGLFKAMQDGDEMTAAELAQRTGTTERYVREWLPAQAAAATWIMMQAADTFRSPPNKPPYSPTRISPPMSPALST